MELSTKTVDPVLIVSVNEDRIDAAVAIEFKDAMRAETLDGPKIVVLNLSSVNFIDLSGLGAIVASMQHMGQDRTLALAGVTSNLDKVFHLTRVDTAFSLFATLEGALEALCNRPA